MRFFGFFAYMLVWLALSLIAAECILRVIHPDWWSTTPRYQSDPASILVPRPNLVIKGRGTNSLGAWGDALKITAETVLVMGDSNIEGRMAAEADSFPVQLETELASVQVANFGVRGYGPDQSVLRLRNLLSSQHELGHVRAVVLHIFADNDLGDLIRNNLPEFNPQVNQSARRIQPEFTPFGKLALNFLVARVIRDHFLRTRFAAYFLPDHYYSSPPWLVGGNPVLGGVEMKKQLYEFSEYKKGNYTDVFNDSYDAAIAYNVSPELNATVLATLDRVLRLFLDLSVQYGFCPLVLVQPSKFDAANTGPSERDPQRLSRLIQQVSTNVGIATLSLFDSFKGKPFYDEEYDNHWNPAGMKEAARLTAQGLHQECGLTFR